MATQASNSAFDDLLSERGYLLADGATGTNLFDMGLESGEAPEAWLLEHPDRVQALHQSFVDAGSDIFLTNTFGGTRHRLKLHGLDDQVTSLNRTAARLARGIADEADRPVLVAGSVGPTGELLTPLGKLEKTDAVNSFKEQIEGLVEGGIDLVWIETISAPDELEAAAEAARSFDLPVCATMSFDSAGRTMMGLTPRAFASLAADFNLDGFGANCGVGAVGFDEFGDRLCRRDANPADHCQSELRHSKLRRRQDRLQRYRGTNGRLRPTRAGSGGKNHRWLLWNKAGAYQGNAQRAGRRTALRFPRARHRTGLGSDVGWCPTDCHWPRCSKKLHTAGGGNRRRRRLKPCLHQPWMT